MRSDKSYGNRFCKEYYQHYSTVIVTFDIKHISVITNKVSRWEISFQVCMTFPLCFSQNITPTLKCIFCISMFTRKLLYLFWK